MTLEPIEKRAGLSREAFHREYLEPRKPMVFKDLATAWPATEKWTFDWLRQHYGHLEVPLYGNDFHQPGKYYMTPRRHMKLGDYLSLIQEGPTELRMFLYNIFEHAPELTRDFQMPDIMKGWNKRYYFMFFGGEGSSVNLHYDIDCSHVFLTQFQTRKRVYLFPRDQGPYLYREPYTVKSQMDVNDPDYERYPAFQYAQGYETILEHGETLFIPSQYWHHIDYIEGGYSLALRAHDTLGLKLQAVANLATHFVVDKGMNKLRGAHWSEWKGRKAREQAERAMKDHKTRS